MKKILFAALVSAAVSMSAMAEWKGDTYPPYKAATAAGKSTDGKLSLMYSCLDHDSAMTLFHKDKDTAPYEFGSKTSDFFLRVDGGEWIHLEGAEADLDIPDNYSVMVLEKIESIALIPALRNGKSVEIGYKDLLGNPTTYTVSLEGAAGHLVAAIKTCYPKT